MKRLWWRFLDRFFLRYVIGYDPARGDDYSTTVVMQKCRDGTYVLVDVRRWLEEK